MRAQGGHWISLSYTRYTADATQTAAGHRRYPQPGSRRCTLAYVFRFHNVEADPRSDRPVNEARGIDGSFTGNDWEQGQSLHILRGEPAMSSQVVFLTMPLTVAGETA
jgi:hypothetical protein